MSLPCSCCMTAKFCVVPGIATCCRRIFLGSSRRSTRIRCHGLFTARLLQRNIGPRQRSTSGTCSTCHFDKVKTEQTIEIPIGPYTSSIVAEAIATAVDIELKKRLKVLPAGFRYVDDYFLFFATAGEADAALAALIRSLKEFELQINFEKTKTCAVLEITDDYWTHQLSAFQVAVAGRKQVSDLNHFFELAKDLGRRNSHESVMTYALKRASSVLVRKENWDSFEAHLCHVALAYPNTLQTVARLFSTYAGVGYPIRRTRLERLINAIVQDHAPLGHHSEVAWCLWMCMDVELKLSESNIDLVSDMHSSICALLLLDLCASGKLVKAPKSAYWKQPETTEALHGELRLLSYEAGMRGWLASPTRTFKATLISRSCVPRMSTSTMMLPGCRQSFT